MHLQSFSNVSLICDDYLCHEFNENYDVIYSSLTFMHIKDKLAAIRKAAGLLKPSGRFILSFSKSQQTEIDYGNRRIAVFPDTPKEMIEFFSTTGLIVEQRIETEFAVIFAAKKMTEMQI